MILFDQFEEVFTLAEAEAEAERRAVAEVLGEALRRRPDHLRLVLGVRSDYLGPAAALPGLGRLLKRPWVLRPPRPEELRDIVEKPAELHGYTFQGPLDDGDPRHRLSLAERILRDPLLAPGSGGEADIPTASHPNTTTLPLLEFALERLWLKALAGARTSSPTTTTTSSAASRGPWPCTPRRRSPPSVPTPRPGPPHSSWPSRS